MSINITLLVSNMNDSLSGYNILGFQYISLKNLVFISLLYFSNCGESDVNLNFFSYKLLPPTMSSSCFNFSLIQDFQHHSFG